MKPIRFLYLATLFLLFTAVSKAGVLRVEPSAQPNAWTIFLGQKKLLVYAFDPAKPKPYVKELCPLNGGNILRDSPHDHRHHHGLMYGVSVNRLDFWGELPGCGVEKAIASPPPEIGTDPAGLPQAVIRQTLYWLAPQDAFQPDSPKLALLVEHRTLTLVVNEARDEVALHWHSQFEVGGKAETVTLGGASYVGLGARFLESLDPLAEHFNSDGKPDLSGIRQDTSQHDWSAVTFDRPGAPVTFAMFGSPENARGNATFFTMKRPFAYVTATQALNKQTLVYHTGDKFQLDYLVTVYSSIKTADFLNERAAEWRKTKH